MMSRYFTVWVSLGILAPFLLATGDIVCSEKEAILGLIPSTVTPLTDCLMECTRMTYSLKLQLQDQHNIRLKDSTEGELGEYCWPTALKCSTEESFRHAYVMLPVDVSTVTHDMVEVRTVAPAGTTLHVQSSQTTIPEGCGLRYDVTQQFSEQAAGTPFCVHVVVQQDVQGAKVLKCPPYLATVWQRSPNQSNQEDGG